MSTRADRPLDLSVSMTEISQNRARLEGAGLFSRHTRVDMTNVTLSGNVARDAGGAVRATDSTVLLDRVTVVVIPDTSHALFPEHPEAVAAALANWIARLPAP